jgi:predicted secreted protein
MAAASMLAAACASTPPATPAPQAPAQAVKPVELDNAADGTRVTLARGNELKVLLDAQALAGLQWRVPKDVAPVLSPIGERIFLSNGLDPRYLGGGGWNVFRYRAERSGRVTLVFDYGPFDLAAPATRTVRYEVTVE